MREMVSSTCFVRGMELPDGFLVAVHKEGDTFTISLTSRVHVQKSIEHPVSTGSLVDAFKEIDHDRFVNKTMRRYGIASETKWSIV